MLVPREVFSVASHADTTSSRYAFGGVQFSRAADGTATAVATDGRRLIVTQWREPKPADYPASVIAEASPNPSFSVLIPQKTCREAGRWNPGKRAKAILQNVAIDEHVTATGPNACRVSIAATDLEKFPRFDCKQMEGRYPRWQDAIPAYDASNSLSIAINHQFLVDAAEALGKIGTGETKPEITLTIDRENHSERPLLITACHLDRKAAAVIMPCNQGNKGPSFPEWNPASGKVAADFDRDWQRLEAERDNHRAGFLKSEQIDELCHELAEAKAALAESRDETAALLAELSTMKAELRSKPKSQRQPRRKSESRSWAKAAASLYV